MTGLLVLFVTAFVDMVGLTMIVPLLPYYATDFGASAGIVGLLVSAFSIAQLLAAPVWGRFSDRYGRRPAILAGLLITAAAYVLFGIAGSVPALFLARTVQGIGGGTIGVVQAYVADVTAPEHRARGMGIIGIAFGLGFILGPAIGGLIVDGGNFDWAAHPERQPALNTPDPSYHGAVWTEAVKPIGPVAYAIKARVTLLRDIGASLSPFNAFLIIQGLETLALRMNQHCKNAQAVVDFLRTRKEIKRIIHPSQQQGVHRERADRYLKGNFGGLVGFELAGGKEAGRKFIDALQLHYHVANIGDARSLAIHPATTTHSQLTKEEQLATGVSDGYVRLSVGIEHIDDIVADIKHGLEAASRSLKAA